MVRETHLPLEPGMQLGRYRLVERLNQGGMGELWRAKAVGPAGFDKDVVLKTIRCGLARDPSYEELFLKEARLVARLSHPNVVQVFDLGREGGIWYMAMELVHGVNMRRLLRMAMAMGRLPAVPVVLRAVRCVAEALAYIHSLKDDQGRDLSVVHRDINPDNILLSFSGTTKLCDFGIAKAHWHDAGSRDDWDSALGIGKLAYLAPEQVGSQGRRADRRTDIYALGVTLYEALTGKQPFWRPHKKETLAAILSGEVDPPTVHAPWLSSKVEGLVLKAMARDPEERYQTAEEMARTLDTILGAMPVYPTDELTARYLRDLFSRASAAEAASTTGQDTVRLEPDLLTPALVPGSPEMAAAMDGFSGRLEGLDIFEFLQMVLVSRRKTVLEVVSRDRQVARLYISDGDIVHAECCGMTGRDAFFGCLAFSGGAFSSLPWEEPSERSITEPGEFLLLEAARLKDEAERDGASPRQARPRPCETGPTEAFQTQGPHTAPQPDEGLQAVSKLDFVEQRGDLPDAPAKHEAAVWFEKGWQYVRQGRYRDARECWGRALALDPGNRTYRTNMEILEKRLNAG